MKSTVKLTIAAALTLLAGTSLTSCKDYLQEELVSTLTYDYYDTEQGLEDLVKAAYEPTRNKFGYEHAYALFNFGTDEFTSGDQTNFAYYNTYGSQISASGGGGENFMNDIWAAKYDGINRCNIGIERIPAIQGTTTLQSDAQKRQRVAELRFLRAIYFFELVQQFGAIPLPLKASVGVQLEFPRVAVPEVYKAIISDLRYATDNLAPTNSEFGRARRGAAQHFLAKVYLTRGSAVTDVRGQQPTDMDSAAYYADQVINASGVYQLESDYGKLWDVSNYNNSRAAQTSKEIIFSAQFNNSLTLAGRLGNQTHLYYLPAVEQDPGMQRDLNTGRPFRRLMPTDYAMDIYDRRNDSRFYKSFQTTWRSNNSATLPKWTASDGVPAALVGKNKFEVGDTAIQIVVNTRQNPVPNAKIRQTRYRVYARYRTDATNQIVTDYNPNGTVSQRARWPQLVKFLDPFRASLQEQKGTKDGILARLGETYLIAAEAYGRKGDYATAVARINTLRQRAAYKAGEQKPPQFWQYEGGTRGDASSTYANLTVTEEKFNGNAASELYPASLGDKRQRFIHFILNERSRELMGELYRWEDLVRTETLLLRAKTFNTDATGIMPFHKLRPIPQPHLERVYRNGQPLSADERQAEQNPGY